MRFRVQTSDTLEAVNELLEIGAIITNIGKDFVEYTFSSKDRAMLHEQVQNAFDPNVPMYPPGYHYDTLPE